MRQLNPTQYAGVADVCVPKLDGAVVVNPVSAEHHKKLGAENPWLRIAEDAPLERIHEGEVVPLYQNPI